MKKIAMTVRACGMLWAAGSAPALADHNCEAEACYAQAERPQWVMEFALDDCGQLVLASRGRSAEYIAVGGRHHHKSVKHGQAKRGARGYNIVVVSEEPFVLPRHFGRHQTFVVGSKWKGDDTRRLCRLMGVRPGVVRVTVTACEPEYFESRRDVRVGYCPHDAWPWAGLERADKVYVDGSFRGAGFAALLDVSGGGHRVTVVTGGGRKLTRWVSFPTSDCGSSCRLELVCR